MALGFKRSLVLVLAAFLGAACDVYDASMEWPKADGDRSEIELGEASEYPPPPYGTRLGDTMASFTLNDCAGQAVSLAAYCGTAKAFLITSAAGWCSGCRAEAPILQNYYDSFKDKGLIVFTLLFQTSNSEPADQAFCQGWQERYGLSFPVLADPSYLLRDYYPDPNNPTAPATLMLDRNMRIIYQKDGGGEDLTNYINAALDAP